MSISKSLGVLAAFSILSGLAASPAVAQLAGENEGVHVLLYKFHQPGWTYHAIYSRNNGIVRVDNVLALADPGTVSGNNLKAVWWQRTDEGWQSKSWEVASQAEAAKYVSGQLSIPDDDLWRWVLDSGDLYAAGPASAPMDYSNGMLVDDPAASVVSDPETRDQLLMALQAMGYSVANVPAEKIGTGSCGVESVYVAMSAATEVALSTPSTSGAIAAAAFGEALIGACGGSPGEKGEVVVVDWSKPYPELLDPSKPPHRIGEVPGNPGANPPIELWDVPGHFEQHAWCLSYPADGVGPPYALCGLVRDRGNCVVRYQCPEGVGSWSVPPCLPAGTPQCDTPSSTPWTPVSGDCSACGPYTAE